MSLNDNSRQLGWVQLRDPVLPTKKSSDQQDASYGWSDPRYQPGGPCQQGCPAPASCSTCSWSEFMLVCAYSNSKFTFELCPTSIPVPKLFYPLRMSPCSNATVKPDTTSSSKPSLTAPNRRNSIIPLCYGLTLVADWSFPFELRLSLQIYCPLSKGKSHVSYQTFSTWECQEQWLTRQQC